MTDTVHQVHEELSAHFTDTVDSGFGSLQLRSGLNGLGTIYMTPTQAKRLADAIYQQLGLIPT